MVGNCSPVLRDPAHHLWQRGAVKRVLGDEYRSRTITINHMALLFTNLSRACVDISRSLVF